MDLGLRGCVVLLVGGTRGIGRETARLLGTEGARIALVARDRAALDATAAAVREAGGQAAPIAADVTDPAQAEAAVRQAADAFGPAEVFIHAVGRGYRGRFLDLDEETWREAFDLDFFAAVRLVRLVAPHMPRGGRIILLGAASARQPQVGQSPSNAAKAALANLTRSLADELAPLGLTINCVAPGRILTERRRQRLEEEARREGVSAVDRQRADAVDIPLERLGDPAEVAAFVVFLASPRASYMTGQSITVDGGMVRSV